MKRHTYFLIMILLGVAGSFANAATAQAQSISATPTIAEGSDPKKETLSGIYLYPNRQKETFTLLFKKPMQEQASLELSDEATGEIVYANSVKPGQFQHGQRFDVGKLKNGTYLIEVKTSDTTYWTKMKVKNQTETQKRK